MSRLTAAEARIIVDTSCDIKPCLNSIYEKIERVAKGGGCFISIADLFYGWMVTEDMKTNILNTLIKDGYVLKDKKDVDYGNQEYSFKILSWEY